MKDFPLERLTYLFDLIIVPIICARTVIREWLRARELMVAGGSRDYVAMACNLPRESLDGACDLIYFAENDNAREARLWIIRD